LSGIRACLPDAAIGKAAVEFRLPTTRVPGHFQWKLAAPDKPSIAVLPFQNMSGDPEQEYFGDGIAEDIITALSPTGCKAFIGRLNPDGLNWCLAAIAAAS
jgi:hypothetical protein